MPFITFALSETTSMLLGAVGGLCGAVGVLYKVIVKRLIVCERDRKELWETIAHLQGVTVHEVKNRAKREKEKLNL